MKLSTPSSKKTFSPSFLKKYSKEIGILNKNPVFREVIKTVGIIPYSIPIWKNINEAVLYSVVGQMLSDKATIAILKKISEKFSNLEEIFSWAEQNADKKGPIYGLSQRKRKALSTWKQHVKNNGGTAIYSRKLKRFLPQDFKKEILNIWGFGDWSADMLSIFYLGSKNVFPLNDAGLKSVCKKLFNTDDLNSLASIVNGAEAVAAIYLWEYGKANINREPLLVNIH